MASKLRLRQYIDLPFHPEGDFDRGGVLPSNGSVFIANTAADTVEIVDGEGQRHLATIAGCPEASAVLTVQEENLIFLGGCTLRGQASGDGCREHGRLARHRGWLSSKRLGLEPAPETSVDDSYTGTTQHTWLVYKKGR